MRKTSLILLGATASITGSLIAIQPRMVLDGARAQAAAADTYRQLSLFGDVFERVQADFVEKPNDEADRIGDQRYAGRTRSAFELHESQELP